ncbi:hypothetical protein V2J09_020014 [Rumex salicifolius]
MKIGCTVNMALSFSDCYPDLICAENSTISTESPADFSSDLDSPAPSSDQESIAGLIEDERNLIFDYSTQFRSLSVDPSARALSVAWILKVRAFYGFQPLTAYLAVNYFDRFLCSHRQPQSNGWLLQLSSVACLSIAAKLEELFVPSLLDFQVEDAKFMFQPKTIQRMELLILGVLDWRMRSVTPFCFISFFANKLDATGNFTEFLASRSTDIILFSLQEAKLLEYKPSSIAAAAVLCAASEIPNLSLVTPEHAESWCDGLNKEKVISCYRVMQQYMMENGRRKALPQLRVISRTRMRSSSCSISEYSSISSSPISSSSSSSTTPTYYSKRRKLNNFSWIDLDLEDDKRSSD